METLSSNHFIVSVSRSTGGVYHLSHPRDVPFRTNYVCNPRQHPTFDVEDSNWLGDVRLTVNGDAQRTGRSSDVRAVVCSGDAITVSYTGTSSQPGGIRGFELTENYRLTGDEGDTLEWIIRVTNTSGASMTVDDLSLPMLMNGWWDGGHQPGIYEQNVGRHSFVGLEGSYVYWQRPNGVGPFLVLAPQADTALEFRNKARTGEGPFGEVDPSWEGLVEFAIHSRGLQVARNGAIEGYLPATGVTLAPGEAKTYAFAFTWAQDYVDLRQRLYDAGVVDVVSLPGMVIPGGQVATVAVRAKDGIDEVIGNPAQNIGVTERGTRNGYRLYELSFNDTGPHQVTVRYGGGRRSILQYNVIAPIAELIEARAAFLVAHQQARGTGRGYEGAFLQWDMSRKQLITWHDYPGGGWKRWMAGGSDELGLAPAEFLSEKNVHAPRQDQVEALDYFLEHFIWGYLQTQTDATGARTYRIYHWYDGTDGSAPGTPDGRATWRVMNYPHVWNTYFNMYRIARAYPSITTALGAEEYLMRAYRTMRAYFEHPNAGTLDDASREMGSMGEMTMPDIVEALRSENHAAAADDMERHIRDKARALFGREYPFASEMSIDTTAFETVYTLARRYGNTVMADTVTRASMASRGMQPLWYYYGSDNRHMGESWWNLGYETQLGAWQQQDYLRTHDPSAAGLDFHEAMRQTYGAYLAGWSNINTGQISASADNVGAASWQYQSQGGAGEAQWAFMPMISGWWAWSGEADLGFWGGLRAACVNVVDDPVVGLYAYGAQVRLEDRTYTVVPWDGVQSRLTVYTEERLHLEVEHAQYAEARISMDRKEIQLVLRNVSGADTYVPSISMRNLPPGTYRVSVDGEEPARAITSDGQGARVDLTNLVGASHVIRIQYDGDQRFCAG